MFVRCELCVVLLCDSAVSNVTSWVIWSDALSWVTSLDLPGRRFLDSLLWCISCLDLILLLRLSWYSRLNFCFFCVFVCADLIGVYSILFRFSSWAFPHIFVFGFQVYACVWLFGYFFSLFFKILPIVIFIIFLIVFLILWFRFWLRLFGYNDIFLGWCFPLISCWRFYFFNFFVKLLLFVTFGIIANSLG